MTNNLKSAVEYIPYKEVVKKKALEYYQSNKEAISQKRKDKYKQLPPEDKKKLQENNKQWFNNLSREKQLEFRIKARKYHKNRYDNMLVKQLIICIKIKVVCYEGFSQTQKLHLNTKNDAKFYII